MGRIYQEGNDAQESLAIPPVASCVQSATRPSRPSTSSGSTASPTTRIAGARLKRIRLSRADEAPALGRRARQAMRDAPVSDVWPCDADPALACEDRGDPPLAV